MPEAISFVVNAYYKLAKGETGLTNAGTRRIAAPAAIDFILNHLADDEATCEYLDEDTGDALPEGGTSDITRITIDWRKVPDSIKHPKLPARRR